VPVQLLLLQVVSTALWVVSEFSCRVRLQQQVKWSRRIVRKKAGGVTESGWRSRRLV
jgi:hypothetical protein